jgi:DNA-binding transcriptional MerR regulator
MDDKIYTIKQTALITGLTDDTLRYYERIGLVGPIARAPSGHRRYSQIDLSWIDFLTKMLSTGMTLESLGRYIELFRQGDETAGERRAMLETHARQLQDHMSQLQETLSILNWKINHYDDLLAKQKELAIGKAGPVYGGENVGKPLRMNGNRAPPKSRQPV